LPQKARLLDASAEDFMHKGLTPLVFLAGPWVARSEPAG